MKTSNHESCPHHCWSAYSVDRGLTARRGKRHLSLLMVAAVWTGTACATSYAQTVIGSPGGGFQHWTAGNLNNNGAPFWDAATKSSGGAPNNANIGFCLTGTGDCAGVISHAPGPLAFWGMSFNSRNNSGGAMDPKVYFRRSSSDYEELKATLELQFATAVEPNALNEIGWFETNANGSVIGTKHVLFRGSGGPPDPVGKKVTFKPTEFFGYYFKDLSENGCHAYTLSSFNEPGCKPDHNLVVFSTHPNSHRSTFWIAGEDPPGCGDGDCNLTVMKVSPEE